MSDPIFLIRDDRELVELVTEPYDSEDLLQALLARFPNLLSVGSPDGQPGELLLIARELGLPGESGGPDRWSVDHLFVDREGVPRSSR